MAGAWAAVAGAAANFLANRASSMMNSALAWHYRKKEMEYEYDLQQRSLLNSPTSARQGYENAGYNPLLAIGAQTGSGVSSSFPLSDSDQGTEAVNSAIDAIKTYSDVKNVNENTELIKDQQKGVELDNRLKEKQLNTSPKAILSDLISGNETPVTKNIKKVLDKIGVDNGVINSAISSDSKRLLKNIDLSDKKPYVQKGVPRSVVNSFKNRSNSAVSIKKYRELNNSEVDRLSKKRVNGSYNRPPSSYPY